MTCHRYELTSPRRLAIGVVALAGLLGLAGCGARPQDCARVDVQCAGLVTDFGSVDEGVSREAWLALTDARSAGLLERVDLIETVDTRDRAANIAAFTNSGYDIIITVGAGITDETLSAAEATPSSYFIGVQQAPEGQTLPHNYAILVFHDEQSGFLAGAVAGLITHSGRVAAVCEAEFIDSVRRTCDGFPKGAEYVNPGVRVEITHRSGSDELIFHDRAWGADAASDVIDRGADVVFAIGEETADAALDAAAERGVTVIGAETDQFQDLPAARAALVTSAILEVRGGLLQLVRDTVEGQFNSGRHWGEVGLAPFHDFAGRLPPGAFSRLAEITDDLRAGVLRFDASE